MALDKIKVRNLDKDVFQTFRNSKDKLSYDDLSPEIVAAIKNGTGMQLYNDVELRTRIINLESNKLNSAAANTTYRKINDSYNRTEIDSKVSALNTKTDSKIDIATGDSRYILNKNGIINETMLSDDLKNKVNARYENKRPESTGGGSGDITTGQFNSLKNQVDINTTNITNVQNYISTSVITVNDKIGKENLESPIVDVINHARLNTKLIAMTDLDDDIKKRLSNTAAGSYIALEEGVAANKESINNLTTLMTLEPGELIFGDERKVSSPSGPVIKHGPVFAGNIWIVPDSAKINEAMAAAKNDDVNYLIVMFNEEVCKLYAYENGQWEIKDQESPTVLLAGRFAREYGTDNIYFGFDKDDFDMIINISDLATKEALNTAKNSLTALQKTVTTLNNTVTQMQQTITSLTTRVQTLETKVK